MLQQATLQQCEPCKPSLLLFPRSPETLFGPLSDQTSPYLLTAWSPHLLFEAIQLPFILC